MKKRLPTIVCAIALMLCFPGAGAGTGAWADTITLDGTTIPMPGVRVLDIKEGRVHFTGAGGRRDWREIADVAALGFEGLDALDEAERLLNRGESDAGLIMMLSALLDAEPELQRLWIRLRLVRLHAARGEYAPSAGHAAIVFIMRDEASWRMLEPMGRVGDPTPAQMHEALANLREAKKSVSDRGLKATIDRMITAIRTAQEQQIEADDESIETDGATLSGLPIDRIRAAVRDGTVPFTPNRNEPSNVKTEERAQEARGASGEGTRGNGRRVESAGGPDTPEAIDRLIKAHRTDEALEVCEQLARSPGARSLAQFAHQYAQCLEAEGRPREALIMYLRGGLVFETSRYAPSSLLAAATLYEQEFDDTPAVRRLLTRTIDVAAAQKNDDIVQRAQERLTALDEAPEAE